ncbi:hypothetical protein C0J45_8833, partial [Silurus meridionalis]
SCLSKMLVSQTQKITLLSCLILSMALFLPKLFLSARKEKVVLQLEGGRGSLPAVRPGYGPTPREDKDDDVNVWTPESLSRTTSIPESFWQKKTFQKSPLLTQVTPIYGFGIFLYIIYIFYKVQLHQLNFRYSLVFQQIFALFPFQLTHKEQSTKQKCRFTIMMAERMETPETSKIGHKKRKLQHLRKISNVLLERRMLEDVTPEEEAEETPYYVDWEGYPKETFPQYEVQLRRRYPSFILEEPYGDVSTPEELAERIESEEEEDKRNEETEKVKDEFSENQDDPKKIKGDGVLEKGEETEDNKDGADEDHQQDEEEKEEVSEDQPCLAYDSTDEQETPNSPGQQTSRRRQISFSIQRQFFYCSKTGSVRCSYGDVDDDDYDDDDYDDDDNKLDEDDLKNTEREEELQKKKDKAVQRESEKENEMKLEEEMEMGIEEEMEREEMEEDDPLMEAERLDFSNQLIWDPEVEELDLIDFLLKYKPEPGVNSEQSGAAEATGLMMRYKNQKKEN